VSRQQRKAAKHLTGLVSLWPIRECCRLIGWLEEGVENGLAGRDAHGFLGLLTGRWEEEGTSILSRVDANKVLLFEVCVSRLFCIC
jgi:hypothetical protein